MGWYIGIALVLSNLVCYIGLGIRETACVRNLAIANSIVYGPTVVIKCGIRQYCWYGTGVIDPKGNSLICWELLIIRQHWWSLIPPLGVIEFV